MSKMVETGNIKDLLPKTLDEIVRKNRDLVEIRLAMAEEIAPLQAVILGAGPALGPPEVFF